jgi:predicted permease
VALGGVATGGKEILRDISVDIVRPTSAIIRKDMKLATRNLGSMVTIILPILMIFTAYPIVALTTEGLLRSSSALIGAGYITSFTGVSFIGLLSLDSEGASLHEGLPIDSRMILNAKVRVFTVQFTLAMSVLVVWFALASPITPLLVLLPIIQLPCAYPIGYLVGAAVYHMRGGGRVVAINIAGDQAVVFLSMALTAAIGAAPLGAYALTLLTTGNHIMALGLQLVVVLLEVLAARYAYPRMLKG